MSEKVYYYLDWDKIAQACRKIADEVRHYDIEVIVPVMRGGLVPSVMISHVLNVDRIIPISINRTEKLLKIISSFKNILLVDDIVDTGNTFLQIKKSIAWGDGIIYSAVVLNTGVDKEIIDPSIIHHGISINKTMFNPYNLHVVFPWETVKEI